MPAQKNDAGDLNKKWRFEERMEEMKQEGGKKVELKGQVGRIPSIIFKNPNVDLMRHKME